MSYRLTIAVWQDPESEAAAAFVYTMDDKAQVLLDPMSLKMVRLPGEGRRGGCTDWFVAPDEENKLLFSTETSNLENTSYLPQM